MSTMHSPGHFKLDIGSVEKDEDKCDFLSACSSLDLRSIRHLVDIKGINVKESVDSIGQNCIHFVVCSAKYELQRQVQLIGYLSSVGASVNAPRSSDGWTPLFLAVLFGSRQLVMTLLQNGAKTDIKDHEGLTPEDLAKKYHMGHVTNLLVHSRSKVPHSRFSCVQQGPALKASPSPSSSEEATTPVSPPSTSSSSCSSTEETPSLPRNMNETKDSTEACLLTAQ